MEAITAKIVVVGSQGVGKTSLVTRYSSHTFSKNTPATVGAAFSSVMTQAHGYKVKLQMWDTAGQECYRSLTRQYYRDANAALLVFDITDTQSFVDAQYWADELEKNAPQELVTVVLGNKVDLEDQSGPQTTSSRRVSKAMALKFAEKIGGVYFEASALTNDGVEAAFNHIALILAKRASEEAKHNRSTRQPLDIVTLTEQRKPRRRCC